MQGGRGATSSKADSWLGSFFAHPMLPPPQPPAGAAALVSVPLCQSEGKIKSCLRACAVPQQYWVCWLEEETDN